MHRPTFRPRTPRRRATLSRTSIAALAALAAAACAGARGGGETSPEPASSTAELEALYRARMDSARMDFAEADVRFMTGMIAHHAQALVMADLAPTHGAAPSIRTLAARIINAQRDEIDTMQRWLRDRGQPVPEVEIGGTTLRIRGPGSGQLMPGMLTPAEMAELDGARGRAFDRLFLTYMIQHHRGAVTMVHDLFDTDGAAQGDAVFKLASDIQVDQLTEIARMERMLEGLPETAPGPRP